ncbi:MAG: sigma-54-dependent Fis family transcriptional regulator, partial [Deltaproteobacteria bacterium]|nr:sigma-54-dependent Fis family transcriptional regulator [Deltaproteobacteria bacterium]
MDDKKKLTSKEREFFSLVARAVFANPFSDERKRFDLEISGLPPGTASDKAQAGVIQTVGREIAAFERQRKASVTLFSGDDYERVKNSLLFHVYYQYAHAFDRLISDQIKAGDAPIKVPFAGDVFALLVKYGFPEPEAYRYFSIFYQMRRAFFFIERGLVGTSPCMRHLRLGLWNNVFTYDIGLYEKYLWNRMEDFSTLLLGETGTGKGTAAAAIGRSGFIPFNEKRQCFEDSFTRTFISLNLSQFSESLIESELFGHRKGAFTGAIDTHKGILEQCGQYSSIFLDEIGETSTPVQIKLLQVLQERTFSPVGSHEKKRFQGRVIAATNRDINELRTQGRFRDDFFYRLCSDTITVPPLRQRLEEDPNEVHGLLSYTLERMVGKPSPELVGIVQDVISKTLGDHYPWPGNVRELEQCVRRVLLKRSYIGDERRISPDERTRLLRGIDTGAMDAQTLLSNYCVMLYNRFGTFEEVARRTNLDRRTVKKYIQKYG